MKKFAAFIIAVSVCAVTFSCTLSDKNQKQPKNSTAEQLSDIAYKRSIIEAPDKMNMLFCLEPYNNGQSFFLLGLGGSGLIFYTADTALTSFSELEFTEFRAPSSYDLDIADDGSIIQVVNNVDYGDLPEPDITSEDYDEELYENAAEYCLTVNKYSIGGELISSAPVKDFPQESDKNTQITQVISDGESVIAEIDSKYYVMDIDGNLKGELKSSSSDYTLMQVGKDREQNLICAMINFDTDEMQLCNIDAEKAVPEASSITYGFSETITGQIYEGTGDYSMFFASMTTIYGIRSDDASIEAVFSLTAAGVSASSIGDYYIDTDGSVVIPDNGNYTSLKIRRYTQCDPAELENIPVLTVGVTYADSTISEYISELNDLQSDYRVEIKLYDTSGSQYESAVNQFQQDILSGDIPDIFVTAQSTEFCGVNLEEKGVLCDLYEFIDTDGEISRDSFIENVISTLESDGHLYGITDRFIIDAGYAAKTKYVEHIDEWNLDSYMELLENIPDGMYRDDDYMYISDSKYLRFYCFSSDYFVDYKNGVCSFDSPEFIRILKYCDEPSEVNTSYDDISELSDEEVERREYEKSMAYINDKALLSAVGIGAYDDLYELYNGTFGGEDVTILGQVGLKGEEGKFTFDFFNNFFSIADSSENKELAWQFVKGFVIGECYEEELDVGAMYWGFPITKSGLEIKAQADMARQEAYEQENYEGGAGVYYWYGSSLVNIGKMDESDIDEVNDIIASISEKTVYSYYTGDIDKFYSIFYEEIDRFFNGGCTAEKCAEVLQNRISLLFAEQS